MSGGTKCGMYLGGAGFEECLHVVAELVPRTIESSQNTTLWF